ncbi:site-2 protease family protein [Candidatus Jorgensenbacteria bacterium]|nr:site-2 protease family protein [Candidatus Jorgensenbacteria bacterium]
MIILLIIIGLSVLILVHELGHFLAAKAFGVKVEEFGFGFPPRIWSSKRGETRYSLNLLPFGGFVKIYGEDGEKQNQSDSDSGRGFTVQPVWKRSVMVLAGIFMNIILGWFILSIVFMVGAPEHLMISGVAHDSPAALADIKDGDVVFRASFGDINLSDPLKIEDFVGLVKKAGDNEINITLKRGNRLFGVAPHGRLDPPEGQGSLGVNLVNIGFVAEPPLSALARGFTMTFQTIWLVALGFANFFAKLFVTPEVVQTIAGPVGIFMVAAQAGSLGLIYLFQLIALISLNLAVLNLIPFPALDGGRFVLLLVEKLKGSPISTHFQMIVNGAGLIFLIVLMIIVTVKDVSQLIN